MSGIAGRPGARFAFGLMMVIAAHTDASEEIRIDFPVPCQILQRPTNFVRASNTDEPTSVRVAVRFKHEGFSCDVLRVRYVSSSQPVQSSAPWQNVKWTESDIEQTAEYDFVEAMMEIPSGGPYRIELGRVPQDQPDATPQPLTFVEPIGVGEVFLVAGQSYATNTNDERLKVTSDKVCARDPEANTWRIAHDPQPTPDRSDGGSIWPPLGDRLSEHLGVPVGFVNVAWGGTSSAQWLPDEPLFARLETAGKSLGRFRAVLWQQGESDVIEGTSTEQYKANLIRIRHRAVDAWGFEPVWMCAKSTLHPTVYNNPEGEERIRAAIEQLIQEPGFGRGPDTDLLKGAYRGDVNSRRHFSPSGQRRAADLWFHSLVSQFQLPQ